VQSTARPFPTSREWCATSHDVCCRAAAATKSQMSSGAGAAAMATRIPPGSLDGGWSRAAGRMKCSLLEYGFRESGFRTGATAERAEFRLFPRFLSSARNQRSPEVRRELASGERFSAISAPDQATGLPQKPQETCH
jgi:hypothetical protein